ncbi:Uncharacterised protein [Legionella busanensis]|uniref:General stress protein 17M-like domain-containing protein n=1 Tax=Legionella busanensis TaxID=190655 RepID=A0A378JJI1_9GAMM|nr:hypothetical protein [Legionella busanensis]STX51227.1 Uncharacterised protein [Legionella busanensis]
MDNYMDRNQGMNKDSSRSQSFNRGQDSMITGYFHDKDTAENAYRSYLDRGYDPKDINVIMSEDTRRKHYDSDLTKAGSNSNLSDSSSDLADDHGDRVKEGMGVGGAVGAIAGATLGAIAAIGTNLAIPGLGLVIAGPIAAALAGAGAGSLSGGLIGALAGWGIPEDKARRYEEGVRSGGIVMGVRRDPNRDYSDLENDWRKYDIDNDRR